ncbi:hypothetical protein D1AOALGA4SA_9172 [Olavius algarvensis Delta 1 endosymbiont]|nr:hypothetical protein D1AOALGA4SA_9172 [Olavius algarvensis Delta 1 endosymbiont]
MNQKIKMQASKKRSLPFKCDHRPPPSQKGWIWRSSKVLICLTFYDLS